MSAQTASTAGSPVEGPAAGEIVVTAQRRTQILSEVPQSIAVIGGASLERQQATSVSDFANKVPGLAFQQQNPGQSTIVLRGVNTGSVNPTVAIYVDDTPFGASTGQANAGALAGDFDTLDIDRIEVLRGPQGTLYGANAMGGVLRYITTPPKLGEVEGKIQGGVATVEDGSTDWSGNGVINLPLGDKFALRASGFYRTFGGYVDAPNRGASNVNRSKSYGGRASLLFKPVDALSIRLSALVQNLRTDSHGGFDADPTTFDPVSADPFSGAALHGLTRYERGPDLTRIDYRLYNATIDLELGFAKLTSVTSYGRLFQNDDSDVSFNELGPGFNLGDAITDLYESAVPLGVNFNNQLTLKKFTQELRLTSPDSDRFEWVAGGYYTREPGRIFQHYYPFDVASGELLPQAIGPFPELLVAQLDSKYREYAVFASGTWHVTSRFDVTGGARYSHNKQKTRQLLDGALVGGPQPIDARSSEGVVTWSISPRLEVGDRQAIYARVAKGFRPGGPIAVPPGAGADFPTSFESDTLVSYEVGFRGGTADRTFSWDLSAYYIDWKDIQISVVFNDPVLGPINTDGNGGKARSYGAELSGTLRPISGLSATLSVSYTNAKLRDNSASSQGGFKGDSLPVTPKFTANFGAEYEWSIGSTTKAFVGGNIYVIGDRVARFDAGYQAAFGRRPELDGYAGVDLRAGLTFDRFAVTVYAKNLTNSLGLVDASPYGERPGGAISVYSIRPRTIGLTLGTNF